MGCLGALGLLVSLIAGLGLFADALAAKSTGLRTGGGGTEYLLTIPMLSVAVGLYTLFTKRVWRWWSIYSIAAGASGLFIAAVLPLTVFLIVRNT